VNPDVGLKSDNSSAGYRIYDFVGRDHLTAESFYQNPNSDRKLSYAGAGDIDQLSRRFDPDIDRGVGGFNTTFRWQLVAGSERKKQMEAGLETQL